jgi:hypothetical protein
MDEDYRFSALGTLAQAYPEDVKATFRRWVQGIDEHTTLASEFEADTDDENWDFE